MTRSAIFVFALAVSLALSGCQTPRHEQDPEQKPVVPHDVLAPSTDTAAPAPPAQSTQPAPLPSAPSTVPPSTTAPSTVAPSPSAPSPSAPSPSAPAAAPTAKPGG